MAEDRPLQHWLKWRSLKAFSQSNHRNFGFILGFAGFVFLVAIVFLLRQPPSNLATRSDEAAAAKDAADAAAQTIQSVQRPPHNWIMRDGYEYGYAGSISENEQRAGIGSPEIQMFRYLGWEHGFYYIEIPNVSPKVMAICENPCTILRMNTYYRLGIKTRNFVYNPHTLIGMAFEDAFNENIEPDLTAKGFDPQTETPPEN